MAPCRPPTPSREGRASDITRFGAPGRRATDFLLLLNAAAFLAQFATNDRLLLWGAKVESLDAHVSRLGSLHMHGARRGRMQGGWSVPCAQDNQLIRAGQWWRFITPVALHANLMHLLTNNYSLNRCCTVGLDGRRSCASSDSHACLLQPGPASGALLWASALCVRVRGLRSGGHHGQLRLQPEPRRWRLGCGSPPWLPLPTGGSLLMPAYGIHHHMKHQGLFIMHRVLSYAGAIFGLGGALAVYAARHRNLMGTRSDAILNSLGQSLALNVAIGLTSPRIDQWCAAALQPCACAAFYEVTCCRNRAVWAIAGLETCLRYKVCFTLAVHACRGHFGGMVGGALAAYLLGPCIRKDGQQGLTDSPPLPIFARKP